MSRYLLLVFLTFSCDIPLTPMKNISYIIPKGQHQAQPDIAPTKNDYWICLTESCKYEFGDADQYDVNKLFGYGFASAKGLHRYNSGRLGWYYVPENGYFQLVAYLYVEGERVVKPLTIVKPGQWFKAQIVASYLFRKMSFSVMIIEDMIPSIVKVEYAWPKYEERFPLRYHLSPYFGGNKRAPHDMIIHFNNQYPDQL